MSESTIRPNGVMPVSSTPLPGHPAINCGDCGLHDLCIVEGLNATEIDQLSGMVSSRRRIKRGEHLFKAGDAFDAIYPIRLGFFKSRIVSGDGREQVIGFPMPGDILGFDAINGGKFQSDAVALEDAEVCVIPFAELETLSRDFSPLQQRVHRVFSREIVKDQSLMLLLGTMKAEERVGAFLLNMSQRFQQRGFSSKAFVLRMTREEIGNYLGLKLETVSRTLSRLQQEGVIAVDQKNLTIIDPIRLRDLAGVC